MAKTEHFKVRIRKAAFVSYRSIEVGDLAEGVRAVLGKRNDGTEVLQSMEFDRSEWPHPDAAREWTKRNRDQLEAKVPGGDWLDLSEDLVRSSSPITVDREAGAMRRAKLLGAVSANGHKYAPKALQEAATHYRAGDGVKVNLDHPDRQNPGAPRKVAERWAKVDPSSVVVESEGVFGDVVYNPEHPLTKSILWFAEKMPSALGFSHNGRGSVRKHGDTLTVESIRFIRHVDLVTDPATTSGLFESLGTLIGAEHTAADEELEDEPVIEGADDDGTGGDMDLKSLTKEELRRARPDLVEAVLKEDLTTKEKDAEVKSLREERDKLKTKVDEADVKTALAAKKEKAEGLITEAKLPKTAVTEPFMESLLAAKDEAGMKSLVEDRAKLVLKAKPTSRERDLGEGTGGQPDTSTSKSFAASIRA